MGFDYRGFCACGFGFSWSLGFDVGWYNILFCCFVVLVLGGCGFGLSMSGHGILRIGWCGGLVLVFSFWVVVCGVGVAG